MSKTQVQLDKEIFEIASELEQDVAAGEVIALAIVFVRKNGDVSHILRYVPNTKFPLLAGMDLAHHALLHMINEQP
jgi:hypothetical protein